MLPFLGFYFGTFNPHGNIEFFVDNSNFLVMSLLKCTRQLLFAKKNRLNFDKWEGKVQSRGD